ncbi:MAG: tetratricopeptide repeat protein [Bacteroidaceae bacterium]|nr:tetratricopeptide repeat protein [Bacteroidaceae bacterium]
MRKLLFTLVVMMCATLVVNAQTAQEKALKEAEKAAKLADKNLKNGKLQYEAALAFFNDEMGDKKDLDRAQMYAERAVKIAQEFPSPKDTLQGLSCMVLGLVHLQKNNAEEAMKYLEMSMDGFNVELGRNDPVTNGSKLVYGYMMINSYPLRGFPKVMESFFDNAMAPEDKRIENMAEANILLETSLEMLIAQQTKMFRYALPMVTYKDQKYLVVETTDWCMERPLVGWLVPSFMEDEEACGAQGDDLILVDDNINFHVFKGEERHQVQLQFNFKHFMRNPKHLEANPDDTRIWFLEPENYKNVLNKYREFKAAAKVTE